MHCKMIFNQHTTWSSISMIFSRHYWYRGAVVITTAQILLSKPEHMFCAGSKPPRGVLEIRDGEDLWQWSRLEIRLNTFHQSTIPQKQFIIIIYYINSQHVHISRKELPEGYETSGCISKFFRSFAIISLF